MLSKCILPLFALLWSLRCLVRNQTDLALENLALRQQLLALRRKTLRPKLRLSDRLFWLALRRFWSRWRETLVIVPPETVVRWHRAGFRLILARPCARNGPDGPPQRLTRAPRPDSADGRRQSHLARAPHSRRTAHARL